MDGDLTRSLAVAGLAVAALATLPGCSSGDGRDGDLAAFCTGFDRLSELVRAAAVSPDELEDVAAARALADDIAETARELPGVAPDAVADDVDELADVTVDLATELRDFYQGILDDPARANDPAFLTSFEPVTEERRAALEEAGAAVRPFVTEHCTGEVDPTTPSTST